MSKKQIESIESRLAGLNEPELRRLLVSHLTAQKLGLVWERDVIARDEAINADVVLPEFIEELSCRGPGKAGDPYRNLIIEGDNFDSLRLLKTTHANKIRVIYIDPPYNTGNKDWVYNDSFVGENDRWRHSQWLEFLFQRLELARDLLTPDGVILVSINDENRDRLGLLMDEVFPGMRIGSFVWKTRIGSQDAAGLLSVDHEHVLVYGQKAFKFRGTQRDETKYANKDEDERGDWGSQMLIQSKTAKQRPECYYHICNPSSETWYLCDPDSAWRFSSTSRPLRKKARQADPIEAMILGEVILWPSKDKSVSYNSVDEIYAAIDAQTAPTQSLLKYP